MGCCKSWTNNESALNRFILKLAKALYYKHIGYRCDGTIAWAMVDTVTDNTKEKYLDSILEISPLFADVQRNNVSLSRQFSYRFNGSAELGGFVALICFSK